MKTSIIQNKKTKIFVAIFWLVLWQLACLVVNQEILLVSPFSVLKTIIKFSSNLKFWITIINSLFRICSGYFIALIFGTLTAILCIKSKIFYEIIYPFISVVKATPVASFIILALLWIKTGFVPIFISFLMVFPTIWSNVYEGILNTDIKLIEMSNIFEFNAMKKFKIIFIPSVMPYFLAACKTGIGMAWKSGVAAEVICMPVYSIGKMLYQSKIYLETNDLFAWTAIIILLSIIFEKIFIYFINYIETKVIGLGGKL